MNNLSLPVTPTLRLGLLGFLVMIIFCGATSLHAQNDILSKLASSTAGAKGAQERKRLDSIDFQFAFSQNENSGFFDVQQKGETGSKLLYGLRSEQDKTLVEKARDSLEVGIGMYEIRRYKSAEKAFLDCKQFMESNRLTNEIVYLRLLSNLGLIFLAEGKSGEAEKYITKTIQDIQRMMGKNNAAYIANLNNYAKLHQVLGKYNDAEKEFDEALQRCDDYFGDGMQKAIILNNKAMLYQVMGRLDQAVSLMNDAMTASAGTPRKIFQGANSFDNRRFQANLATMYQLSGKYDLAEQNFLAIKNIAENRGQTGNQEFAALLNQLGILYIQMGKNDKVEELLVQSATIYRKRYGEQNIYFAKVINDLGNFHRLNARYPEAEKQLLKAFAIREALLNPTHPDFVKTQEDLAILYWKTGRLDKAYAMYKNVMDKTLDFINRYFPPMSEAEKTRFWDVTEPRFQRFYNFAIESRGQIKTVTQELFDYRIATKALLLNATSKVRDIILQSNNAELKNDYQAWLDMKEDLARTYAFSKKKQRDQNIDLPELERKANAMEKSLSSRSSDFSNGYATEKIRYNQIRDLLSESEAVVDIIRVRGFQQDFNNDVRYAVLILKKGMESPTLVVFENGKALETDDFKHYRAAIMHDGSTEGSYRSFWGSVEPEVQDKKMIYVSPDGVFNQLNLNTLKIPSGDFLIHVHDFALLGNSKDLIGIKTAVVKATPNNSFLLGFPHYKEGFDELPGTKLEVEGISKILKTAGYQVTMVEQNEATEKEIKALHGPKLVHISTHGYFLPDTENGSGSVFGVNSENASHNPLLRSGLVLAGASASSRGADMDVGSNDDGFLTAFEAMNLNLEGTHLVILSACETGLGDVKSGEGVYGLQRAFFVAGAKVLIMSLWAVDDAATQELMTNFYTNWTRTGDLQKSFKLAQVQLMTKYKEPQYWGAFVMIGM